MKFFNIRKLVTLKSAFFSTVLFIATSSCTQDSIINSSEDDITSSEEELFDTSLSASTVNTTNHKEHDFDNSGLAGFVEDQGFSGSALSGEGIAFTNDGNGGRRLKLTWKESEYDGSRRERGHEIKLQVTTNSELYTGFYINVPSGQNNNLLNKNTIIWQLYNWNSNGCSNWTAHLELKGNELWLSYRSACVSAQVTRVMSNFQANRNYAIQIRANVSGNNTGNLTVWVDGNQVRQRANINLGFGSFDNNDNAETSVVGVKMGMYCYETSDYTNNETRILYLDNVGTCVRSGSVTNSLNKIDPRNM